MIDLCTLGTGGTIPLPSRALSSLYLRVKGKALLVDCGEGTQIEIARLGWGFLCIEGLLLTHYHADHCSGLPGFLLSVMKTGRTAPFHIWGPPGLSRVVSGLRVIAPELSYPVVLHELPEAQSRFEAIGLQIDSFPLDHGLPCLGYRFRLPRQPAFLPERAQALGVPLPLWKRLQAGETVEAGGRLIPPEAVLGPERPGLCLLYATDTRPVEDIVRLGEGADLLILEGMYPSEAQRLLALKNRHMLFPEAAALAARAGAKRLLLTHFSTSVEDPAAALGEAQAIFPGVEAASDGRTLTLRYP